MPFDGGEMQGTREMGRGILSGVAVLTASGGYLMDWNRTHLLNPHWTAHARFHDAMTIVLGTGLGVLALRALWRAEPDIDQAALLTALFWGSQGAAYAFPGTDGAAADVPELAGRLGISPRAEMVSSAGMLTVIGVGYLLAGQRRSS